MAHIKVMRDDQPATSWCGEDVRNRWAFQGAEHAALNATNGSVPICERCATAVQIAIAFATMPEPTDLPAPTKRLSPLRY